MYRQFFGKLINNILRDKNSEKYSITKTIALLSFILLAVIVLVALYIMIDNKEIDHFLIGELIIFILTLLGFKNLNKPDYEITKSNKQKRVDD